MTAARIRNSETAIFLADFARLALLALAIFFALAITHCFTVALYVIALLVSA